MSRHIKHVSFDQSGDRKQGVLLEVCNHVKKLVIPAQMATNSVKSAPCITMLHVIDLEMVMYCVPVLAWVKSQHDT